tara:strand:+ start:4213 stop:6069 length:1857 start_codon:yes stop_codon:yes gene_type:complete
MSNKISVFKTVKETSNPTYASIKAIAERIKSGGELKDLLVELKDLPKDKYKEGKNKLPVICFGGEFSARSKEGLVQASGFLTLDFDGVKDMPALKEKIESKPYTILNFRSPSYDGYKAVVRIPIVKSDEEYKVFFKALQKDFPELDESGKDISRACYFSYDPNIYTNYYAVEYRLPDLGKKIHQVKDWDKVNKALRKIEDSVEGEKHIVRLKISHLFGGWVATKALTYADALDLLENAVRKNTTDFQAAMKDVRDGLSAGMNKPLALNDEGKVLDMKVGLGKVYYDVDEVWDKIKNIYDNGYSAGLSLGWEAIDKHLTVMLGTTVIAYGHPYSGKSQWWHEAYVNLATNYGFNIFMMSPETGEVESIFLELMSIYIGKPFLGDNKMTEAELARAKDFVYNHFYIIDTFGKDFNYRDVLTQVEAVERVYEKKIHIVSVDPLNYLDHINPTLRADKAMDKDLDVFNSSARKDNRLNVIVTHARDMDNKVERDRETKEIIREWRPQPKPWDILGGQSSYRKAMNLMCFYRPVDFEGQPLDNHEINEVVIDFGKVKPKFLGRVGKVSMYYDWQKNRYYELQMGKKVYAKGFTPPQEPQQQPSRLQTQGWSVPEEESELIPPF